MADEIAQWLEGIGLGRYVKAFLDNSIDFEVLPEITEDDLRELGLNIGERRRLQKAVRLLSDPGLDASDPAGSVPSDAKPVRHTAEAERRQLTVLFCDLVGSTALSSRLDPEDMRELLRSYQETCARVIHRFDGYVAKFMGDGVYAYFGYPQAHEDDAERALNAGLGIVEQVGALPNDLAVRVGIATGPVVVGDILGEGSSQEAAVTGETPNLAARLQEAAEPNAICVAEGTRRLAGAFFEFADGEPRNLKGIADPARVWRLMGRGSVETRFEAHQARGLSPLVGREEEVGLLVRRWERAKTGDGQVVLLCGQPGIGKSRLVESIRGHLADEPHFRLRYQCSPYHANSPLYPVIGRLERAARFERDDSPSDRLEKLKALLSFSGTPSDEVTNLFATLLSIAPDVGVPPLDLTPEQRKDRTLRALVDQAMALAAMRPVLFVFEDAHWADPTTIELLDLVVGRAAKYPIAVFITYRPEFAAPWSGDPHTTLLTLNRLGPRDCEALAELLAGRSALPAAVVEEIVERTGGIPLFVEELTKTIMEAEPGKETERNAPNIPDTLQDALMARLDRLGSGKEIAQVGSVAGREFGHDLLEAIAPLAGDDLVHAIDRLVQAGLLLRRGTEPNWNYTFKHILVAEVAYQSLLRSRRQQLHARIAEHLERNRGDLADTQPELLAHHFTEADRGSDALSYWLQAGRLANARSAHREALANLEKGLAVLDGEPPGYDRDNTELDFQISLAAASIAAHGYADDRTENVYLRALDLLASIGRDQRQFAVLYGLFACYWNHAQLSDAIDVADELLNRGLEGDDPAPISVGRRSLAVAYNASGRFQEAYDQAAMAVSLYDPDAHRESALSYGHDIGVAAMVHAALASWFLGYPDRAEKLATQSLALSEDLRHPNTLGYTYHWLAYLSLSAANFEKARKIAGEMVAHGDKHRMALWSGWGRCHLGCAMIGLGQPHEGLREMAAGREITASIRAAMFGPTFGCLEAVALGALGEHERAFAVIDGLEELITETNERWWLPEVYRTRAMLRVETAENDLNRAIETAERMQSRMFKLRAATDLARLWQSQGKTDEAHGLLDQDYDWFTEGLETTDLRAAKDLLDALR